MERDIELTANFSGNNVRMRGGADAQELREILKDTQSEAAVPKRTAGITRESIFEKPAFNKKDKVIKYIKMVVLVLVLLIAIVLLARVKEYDCNFQQIAIATKETQKIILIAQKDSGLMREIEIQISGPFLVQEALRKNEKSPALTIIISKGLDENDLKPISRAQEHLLKDPSKFDAESSELKVSNFVLEEYERDKRIYATFIAKNVDSDLGIAVDVDLSPVHTETSIILGTIVLFFLYFMIVTEVVDRTFAALICAALSIGILAFYGSRPSAVKIMRWIDVDTLALLVGMMVLVAILAESGIFDYFAVFAFKVAKGRPWPLINCLCLFTALLATFLDSVTMMLLATPVTIRLCEVLSLDPVPVLICMVIFANIGAAITPVGDPPNVIITLNPFIMASDVNFGIFVLHMFPGVILALIQSYIHVRLLYRKPESLRFEETDDLKDIRHEIATWERTAAAISPYSQDEDIARETINEKIDALKQKLAEAEERGPAKKEKPSFQETLDELTALYPLRNKPLLVKAGITFAFILVLFLGHSVPGMEQMSLGWTALIGAFLLLILADKRDLEIILVRVEWSTLLFFASLFIVMESLAELGVISLIGQFVTNVILSVKEEYRLLLAIVIVLWATAIASAFLDNIPVTTMMVKIIINLSQDPQLKLPLHPLVWSLAYGSCFGGNGTLIGASANVVTAGVSEQHGYKITFMKFFIVCFPVMLGSVAVANIYLMIAHVALVWHDK